LRLKNWLWGCRLPDGKLVVWKLANIYSPERTELSQENAGYEALSSLQGTLLPRKLSFGMMSGWEALVLTLSRVPGRELDLERDSALFSQVRQGLQEIHSLGVLHGDVRCANILVAPCANPQHVVFIDLGRCRMNAGEAALAKEMEHLNEMLRSGCDS
jgi:serine/threonine protein kinase